MDRHDPAQPHDLASLDINAPQPDASPGAARCPGPSWTDILERETAPVPEFFRTESYQYLGSDPIAADRYTSPTFFKAELDRMWSRVWQFAAREDELPEAGDTVVYTIGPKSFLIVRQEDGSIRAFANVCLHRGRLLRTEDGPANEFECPFHGFTWALDGSLKRIPCAWDFPHLKKDTMGLPEVRVATWAGFVMICLDPKAPPLETYLGALTEHFQRWRLEECFTAIWVGKVIPANWKVVAEAFMEAWHSIVTHPQILPFTGDANSRYDMYGPHGGRTVTPFGVHSPHTYAQQLSEQDIIDAFGGGSGRSTGNSGLDVPDGSTARRLLADRARQQYLTDLGYDASQALDADMLDAWTYNVFPNFSPWGGFAPNIVYRWRPWPDQDHTLMEVRLLARKPKDGPMPRAVPMTFLGPDEPWATVTSWGGLGGVFDQDMANLPYVQQGLKASANNQVHFGNYQEARIRQLHQTLDTYLAR
jgi:phenylpropionate dioxygenase-like ring-hydroxylating dioxygenase large terminal subunit